MLAITFEAVMNISNDNPAVDYVQYFTKQFPQDLAKMAALRDELATRQGALNAAQDAIADREKAKEELANAKLQAAQILSDADKKNSEAKIKAADLDARDKLLSTNEASFAKSVSVKEIEIAKAESAISSKNAELYALAEKLTAAKSKLDSDRAALEARIKAFQDRVSSF